MSEPLIKYKIIESKGFSTHEKPVEQALADIKQYMQVNQSWFYIDGRVVPNIDAVTVDTLKNASTVTITNIIIGGTEVQ